MSLVTTTRRETALLGSISDQLLRRTSVSQIDQIDPNPFQPRERIDEQTVLALMNDMREHGFRGSIEVRRDEHGGRLQAVAGHHRLEAWRRLGHRTIPTQLVDYDDREMAASAMKENLLRSDLSPLEQAQGIVQLQRMGMSIREIATELGETKGWVQRRLKLLEAPEHWRAIIEEFPNLMTGAVDTLTLPHEIREQVFTLLTTSELNVTDVRELGKRYREELRRIEATITDNGGTIRTIPREPAAPIPIRPDPVADRRWEEVLHAAQAAGNVALEEAVLQAARQPPLHENPADNPEGHATGLTVRPVVETWSELARELDERPPSVTTGREVAAGLLITPEGVTERPRVILDEQTHWLNRKSEEDRARDRNARFVAILTGIVTNMRINAQGVDPARLTTSEQQALRDGRQQVWEIIDTLLVGAS